jgi:Tfp pilus assembly protein PilF
MDGLYHGRMTTPTAPPPRSPDENQTRLDLGVAYLEMGLRKDAIEVFAAVLERDPGNRAALDWLARARGELLG